MLTIPLYVFAVPTITPDILFITSILCAAVIILLFGALGNKEGKGEKASIYLAGVSMNNETREYRNALSQTTQATARNWYMEGIFGEKRLRPIGEIVSAALIIACFALSIPTIIAVL